MIKTKKSSLFKASMLAGLLTTGFAAQAAGLGKLTVYSAIGQPLNAEVALTASPEELTSLSARLASHDAFKEAGIEFMSALTGLRMSVVKLANGQPVLRLTTDQALNEPFLHFLVELNWTAGRMMREYTFLLDPPEALQLKKPAVAAVAPVTPKVAAPAAPVAKALPEPAAPKAVPTVAASGEEVRVKPGDTLSKIAREHKPDSVSLDQMLVALFNGNRDAFDGKNMNRLRAGKILRLPDAATASSIDPKEARQAIISQAADFNAYKRRLAEAAATAPAATEATGQQAAGKIAPQVEQKAPAAPAADKLEVSRTETAKSAKADAGKGKLEEELIARDKALREASERIAQLEKNLDGLKKLAELKSQAGAQVQQQAEATKSAPVEEKKLLPAAPVVEAKPEPVAAVPAASVASTAPIPVKTEKPGEAAAAPVEAAKPAPVPAAPVAPPPKPEVKKPVAPPPPPPPPEPDFIEENPEIVFGGGGILALLLGYLGYSTWRKKKKAPPPAEPEVARLAEAPVALPQAAAAAAAPVLADDVSILGDFSESGPLTAEENVDPVAEADVLMAYGRDGQAEEILLEGLKSDPARPAIHLKLLELYANRKDSQRFQSVAEDLHALIHGEGADWDKATRLAAELGLKDKLFGTSATISPQASPIDATAEPAPEVPVRAAFEPVVEPAVAEPVPVEVAEMAPAPAVEASNAGSLDFDLDLGTTSMPAVSPEALAAAAPAPAVEEVMSLDFDFDLGTPAEQAAPAPTVAAVESTPAQPPAELVADAGTIDFSFDDELPAAVAEPQARALVVEAAETVVSAASDLDIDFDLDAGDLGAANAAPAGEAAPAAIDLGSISLDLGDPEPAAAENASLDIVLPDIELPPAQAEPESLSLPDIELDIEPAAPASVALPDIDLDLDASVVPAAETSADIALDIPAGGTGEPDDPEVATKLELAQAYEEMGDREGARELLNEVLKEGSSAQRDMAKSRLEQLDLA